MKAVMRSPHMEGYILFLLFGCQMVEFVHLAVALTIQSIDGAPS